jgi:hypothetical protein
MELTSDLNKLCCEHAATQAKLYEKLRHAVETNNMDLIISTEEEIKQETSKDPVAAAITKMTSDELEAMLLWIDATFPR